jgi:hypothetical protein
VTNHFFSGGEAKPYQTILAKGTAVLVDKDGTPVSRCRCGNPSQPPVQLEKQTKCFNCPPNYQPPPPCNGHCSEPDPNAPPALPKGTPLPPGTGGGGTGTGTTKPGEDRVADYQACRAGKPVLEKFEGCKTEYVKAQQACAKNPLNPKCDASVCLESVTSPFVTACASYIDNLDTDIACESEKTPAAKEACISQERDRRLRCTQVPTTPGCAVDPAQRFGKLRQLCVGNPSRPKCAALQVGCAQDASQPGCKALQDVYNAAQPA